MNEYWTKFLATAFVAAVIGAAIIHANAQQPPPDPAFMQKAIAVLQTQRNSALDQAAALEAKVSILTEEKTAAEAKVKALTDKYEPKTSEK
jgi:hypothetical protein